MNNTVFHKRLKQHSRHDDRFGINSVVVYVIGKPVFETHGFQRKVQFQPFDFLLQRHHVFSLGSTIEVFSNQLGKIGQVLIGGYFILCIDEILNRIQRIEDEMPVHTGIQRLLLQSQQTRFVLEVFLVIALAFLLDTGSEKRPQRQNNEQDDDAVKP